MSRSFFNPSNFPRCQGWLSRAWLSGLVVLLLLYAGACRQATAPRRENAPANAAALTPAGSAASTVSTVTVRAEIGFASRQKFLDHYEKHGREFGQITADEYLRQAQTLRDRPAGKDVLEVVRADGVVTRFEKSSGAFLAFNRDLTIRTYFKPNDGQNYFWRQSRR